MADADEAELVERSRAGDRAAFGRLVRAHQRRLLGVSLHMLASRHEAEDAVQETMLRAWRAIGRFDRRSELSTWLYRICVNVCLNAIRRRKSRAASDLDDPRVPPLTSDPSQGDPVQAVHANRLYGRLAAALDRLSPSLRVTVILVLVQGMAHARAAEVLGCSEGTVAWRVHEARRRLRAELGDVLGEGAPPVAVAGRRSS